MDCMLKHLDSSDTSQLHCSMLPYMTYSMDTMHEHLNHSDIGQQHCCILHVVESILYVV